MNITFEKKPLEQIGKQIAVPGSFWEGRPRSYPGAASLGGGGAAWTMVAAQGMSAGGKSVPCYAGRPTLLITCSS